MMVKDKNHSGEISVHQIHSVLYFYSPAFSFFLLFADLLDEFSVAATVVSERNLGSPHMVGVFRFQAPVSGTPVPGSTNRTQNGWMDRCETVVQSVEPEVSGV